MRRHTRHTLVSRAPARALYDLAADTSRWPAIFEPTVHVHHLERGESTERFQLWAVVNGEVKNWISRRVLDRDRLRIRFDQERSAPPIESMGGEWIFEPVPDGTVITLLHDFTAVTDTPDVLDWIGAALDRNSARELAALSQVAELDSDKAVFSFTDSVSVGRPVREAYDFLHRSDRWPEHLPHVRRVVLGEQAPGVQDMEMDTVTADGSAHTTRSLRVCVDGERIAYKQLVPPRLLLGHSGVWELTTTSEGTEVTSTHTVVLNPEGVRDVLGEGTSLAAARQFVQDALSRNSRTTLERIGAVV
ncbi:aromatase/cyclase [Streptomyces sp. ISL-10]|uniref:aromatase/cyclase n=1 Tax=Streptomyces sp. ISL-10 TaxID=2819172 RepID=UPI001BEAE30A|nr:aromatase/cyclase [Streptomyces sp. ISL-10]MBT2368634.1 aromatase/cyclase [Streptomyces sp. ISL-10]